MYFITFSRKIGTNGTKIAEQVATKLGYNFYDTEAINNAAREFGFLESVKGVDEKTPSLFQRLFSHQPTIALERLNSLIYELAKQGNAVFLGRGSHILLRAFDCALHIRVTASVEKRVRNLVIRGYRREAALKAIEQTDYERSAFVKFAFGVDWDKSELYDVVLNMDKLSVPLAVDTVIQMARSDDIKACSIDAMKSIEMMGLSNRAEAALIEAGLTYGRVTSISISVVEPGKIKLSGLVEDSTSKTNAEKLLKSLRGVESVDNQIRVIPASRHA